MDENVCLLVGDVDGTLRMKLQQVGNLDERTSSGIKLDTKYYGADVAIVALTELSEAIRWLAENASKRPISCLLISLPLDQESWGGNSLLEVKKLLSALGDTHPDNCPNDEVTKILVVDTLHALESRRELEEFCHGEEIELVEMHPDEEALKIAEQHHEACGEKRLWELLETIKWPRMALKPNPTKLPEHRSRIEKLIREAEDEDAILALFDKPSHELPDNFPAMEGANGAASVSELLESLEEGRLGGVSDVEVEDTRDDDSNDELERILSASGIRLSTFEPGGGGGQDIGLMLRRMANGVRSRDTLNEGGHATQNPRSDHTRGEKF